MDSETWSSPRNRYNNDASFHQLVDMMVKFIFDCRYTPSEMRKAAVLASIIYHEHTLPRNHVFTKDVLDWLDGKEDRNG